MACHPSQLTKSIIFQRGREENQPPTSNILEIKNDPKTGKPEKNQAVFHGMRDFDGCSCVSHPHSFFFLVLSATESK